MIPYYSHPVNIDVYLMTSS